MIACLLSSGIIVPPYLFLEFYEVLFALFEGGEEDAPVKVRLAFMKERWDPCKESSEYVGDHVQILAPCPLGSLLEGPCIPAFLSRMEGLHEEHRVAHHGVSLPAGGFLVMLEELSHLPGGEGYGREALGQGFAMLRYRARNGGDHPRGGPRRDGARADQGNKIFGEGAIKSQPGRYPALCAPHHRCDPFLREVTPIVEFRKEGRFLYTIPSAVVGPGQDLDEGLFFRTVPDLRHHRVAAEVLQGLHPEVTVEEDEGRCHDHGDDLTDTLDGGGQGEALLGPLYAGMGIAEVALSYLDLPHLSDHDLTPGGGIGRR